MGGGQSGHKGSAVQHGQAGMGAGTEMREQQRARIHASDQQRQQLHDCNQAADRIRTQSRDMMRQSKNSTMTPTQVNQWREQLQNQIKEMNRNHEQLMSGLSEEQKNASRHAIQEIEQARAQLMQTTERLNNQLAAPELNRDRIGDEAHEAERAASQLKKRQSEFAAQLNH